LHIAFGQNASFQNDTKTPRKIQNIELAYKIRSEIVASSQPLDVPSQLNNNHLR
jgi:hypothetical protein